MSRVVWSKVEAGAEPAEPFGREKFSAGLPLDFFSLLLSAPLMVLADLQVG
jgi:hypothetical protein